MQRDKLYEESAISTRSEKESKFYTVFFVMAMIFFVIGGIMLVFTYSQITSVLGNTVLNTNGKVLYIVGWVALLAVFFLIGLAFFLLKNRFNVSYDYTYVDDEVRLTKVFNGRRRKYIATVTMENLLRIGYCDKPSYENALRELRGKKPRILTPNKAPAEEKFFIYLLVNTSMERKIYVLECRKEMLEYFVFAAGRNKWVSE